MLDLAAPLDDAGKSKARTIIANMIVTPEQVAEGMISRVREQGKHMLMPDMLPIKTMGFERHLQQKARQSA